MICEQTTVSGGTMTGEGFVEHKKHPAGFYMPVRLMMEQGGVKSMMKFQQAFRAECGDFVYVMPGGENYNG